MLRPPRQVNMAETLEFNDIFQEVKGSMVRMTWSFSKCRNREEFVSIKKSLTLTAVLEIGYLQKQQQSLKSCALQFEEIARVDLS